MIGRIVTVMGGVGLALFLGGLVSVFLIGVRRSSWATRTSLAPHAFRPYSKALNWMTGGVVLTALWVLFSFVFNDIDRQTALERRAFGQRDDDSWPTREEEKLAQRARALDIEERRLQLDERDNALMDRRQALRPHAGDAR